MTDEATAKELLRLLVQVYPYDDFDGSPEPCIWCRVGDDFREVPHHSICPYKKARVFLGLPGDGPTPEESAEWDELLKAQDD